MSATDTNALMLSQYAECATHTPTNLQVFNNIHQQEHNIHQQEQQSQPGGQNEPSTDQSDDQSEQLESKRQKLTNSDRVEQTRTRNIRRAVNTRNEQNRPANTKAAYNPKEKQWNDFCQKEYLSEADAVRKRLTRHKTYRFLFYHANRSKYKRGGKRKRGEEEDEVETKFNHEDFKKVEGYYQDPDETGNTADPENPLGFSQFNTYVSTMHALHTRQAASDGPDESTYSWEIAFSDIREMKKTVKDRKARVNKATHAERITADFSPYLVVEAIPKIEKKLWERNSDSSDAHAMVGLRDRFTFLMTTFAILRGESLFKAEFADMLHLIITGREPTPMAIFILQMATGKTNEGERLYGRLMRHLHANLCGIGGMGFYFLLRFKVTGEMSPPPDFTVNKNWFYIKLLVGQNARPTTNVNPICDRQYAEVIKKVCDSLQVPACHFTHIGRVTGPPVLELEEIQPEDIRILGNWDPTTQEKVYSAKIPLRSMRPIVGFPPEKGLHWSEREMKLPDESLQQHPELWPWIEVALEAVNNATAADGINRYTALAFLKFMKYLRIVILQDAAVLLHEGRTHRALQEPIFSTPEFLAFQAEMVQHCREATNPCDTNLNQVIPGMNERLGNLQSSVSVGFQQGRADVQELQRQIQQSFAGNNATLAASLRNAANALSPPTAGAAPDDFAAAFSLPPAARAVTATAASVEQQSRAGEPRIPLHALHGVHHSVTSMYNEWHGIGAFLNGPTGGLCALESENKKWRDHFKPGETSRYSRLKRVVQAVHRRQQEESSKENGMELAGVLAEFDGIMKGKGVGNLSNLVDTLQSKDYIPKDKRAKRKTLSSSSSV
jgi:hypothetical protein